MLVDLYDPEDVFARVPEVAMSQNSGDLRVRRTQKLLREALIALIEERRFDAITVGEIAARAMVSRAAFYRHYQDKYDLVEKIFEEMMTTVMREIGPCTVIFCATSTRNRRQTPGWNSSARSQNPSPHQNRG